MTKSECLNKHRASSDEVLEALKGTPVKKRLIQYYDSEEGEEMYFDPLCDSFFKKGTI